MTTHIDLSLILPTHVLFRYDTLYVHIDNDYIYARLPKTNREPEQDVAVCTEQGSEAEQCSPCYWVAQHTATHCNMLLHTTTHDTSTHYNAHLKNALFAIGLHNALRRTATHCNTLQHTATYCKAHLNSALFAIRLRNILQQTATDCNRLQRSASHCTTLHHAAPHCTTLHHTAPHSTTLHHTAPQCTTDLNKALFGIGMCSNM